MTYIKKKKVDMKNIMIPVMLIIYDLNEVTVRSKIIIIIMN